MSFCLFSSFDARNDPGALAGHGGPAMPAAMLLAFADGLTENLSEVSGLLLRAFALRSLDVVLRGFGRLGILPSVLSHGVRDSVALFCLR